MGFFTFFFGGPLSPSRLAKVVALASNAYAQPDVRMRELERLVADGRPEALLGALKRLSVNSQGHIADEDEKQWVEDAMVRAEDAAVAPLCAYIRKEKQLSYAIRALFRIMGETDAVPRLAQLLEEMKPENWQKGEAKLQLVWQLAPFSHREDVFQLFINYLRDHSDDVQWAILEAFAAPATMPPLPLALRERRNEKLGALLQNEQTSLRIARRAASLLVESKMPLAHNLKVPEALDEQFYVDKKHHLRRRMSQKSA